MDPEGGCRNSDTGLDNEEVVDGTDVDGKEEVEIDEKVEVVFDLKVVEVEG